MKESEPVKVQIEKELIAVVFRCTRFHQYIYEKK